MYAKNVFNEYLSSLNWIRKTRGLGGGGEGQWKGGRHKGWGNHSGLEGLWGSGTLEGKSWREKG